ncbi:MAG: formylglycine-generating enzyme family protein [Candidatus Hydrogenedens sp.]|nr:formylglycine-generating enzyme family protein [Candidatus Hydrogenedens sp.]
MKINWDIVLLIAALFSVIGTATIYVRTQRANDQAFPSIEAPELLTEPQSGEMIPVPAGEFQMGRPSEEKGWIDALPVHPVYLDHYLIGKYPVTNNEYAAILNWAFSRGYLQDKRGNAYTGGVVYAYGRAVAEIQDSNKRSQINFDDCDFVVCSRSGHGGQLFSMADHPVVCVSWYGAVCYCNWLSEEQKLDPCYDTETWERYETVRNGYRLPTEAEWERAAAWDGEKHWIYGMTSDSVDHAKANYGYANPWGFADEPCTTPVGWYDGVNPAQLRKPQKTTVDARSPIGAYDMSGNVGEWCHDWYNENYYVVSPGKNPSGPMLGDFKILRGGFWNGYAGQCRTALRRSYTPVNRKQHYVGFRLARTP